MSHIKSFQYDSITYWPYYLSGKDYVFEIMLTRTVLKNYNYKTLEFANNILYFKYLDNKELVPAQRMEYYEDFRYLKPS